MFNGVRRCVVTSSLSTCRAWPGFERHRCKLRAAAQNARFSSKLQAEVPQPLTAQPLTAQPLQQPLQRRKRIQRVVTRVAKTPITAPVSKSSMDSVNDTLEAPENVSLKGGASLKRSREESATVDGAAVKTQPHDSASDTTVAGKVLHTDTNECSTDAAVADSERNKKQQKQKKQEQKQRNQKQQNEKQQDQNQGKKKKRKEPDPVWATVINAVKEKNAPDAWEAYQRHRAEHGFKVGLLLPLATLFLGLEDWTHNVLDLRAPGNEAEVIDAHPEWAEVVMDELESKLDKKDEVLYSQRARLYALKGDPEGALAAAVECSQDPLAGVRLRTYIPALAAYASKGDGAGALKVFDTINSESAELFDLSESEYKFLLHVLGENNDIEGLERVWLHMKDNLGTLQPLTISLVTKYFNEHAGVQEDGSKKWKLSTVKVDPKGDGHVEEAGGRLRQAPLKENEWKQFAKAIFDLAVSREESDGAFQKFANVMAKGDYTIFLDAANIAYYNTLWLTDDEQPNARFQWRQVKAVYEAVQKMYPERKKEIMVVVSGFRIRSQCVHGDVEQQFIDELQAQRRLWCTPRGSNDDWYWLYGTVLKGEKGILVSNDKLRDHIFDLLRPRFFLKWRDNQKCLYDVMTHKDKTITAELQPPPCFTTCVQKVDGSGAWMFPMEGEQWLCARPL